MASHDQLIDSERVRHSHQVQHGDGLIGFGVDQERRLHFLD